MSDSLREGWRAGHLNTMTARDIKEAGPNAFMTTEPIGAAKVCGCVPPAVCSKCPPLHGLMSVRSFSTGATRDSDEGKNDYEGFLSPLVIEAYGDYMTEHRRQSDGSLRDSDNWQKGIPKSQYMKSLLRHVLTAWKLHRGWAVKPEKIGGVLRVPTMRETLCAILFNTMGYLHEMLKEDTEKTEAAA